MFTGIVEGIGTVNGVDRLGDSVRLSVEAGPVAEGVRVGDSVMVSGVCLTAEQVRGTGIFFTAVPETFSKTTLKNVRINFRVNLERALPATGRFDGHVVQGHVDGVAVLEARRDTGTEVRFTFRTELAREMVLKGSVAVDGISLTLAEVTPETFTVAVIPHTLEVTTLKSLRVSDKVNVETDIIGKYVRSAASRMLAGGEKTGIDEDFLRRHGFT